MEKDYKGLGDFTGMDIYSSEDLKLKKLCW